MIEHSLSRQRALAALRTMFVADALAMPVHWYYRTADILAQFPGGITRLEAAPRFHPSSIMSLHSTRKGGRGSQGSGSEREIVGDVILKGKRKFWGVANQHYHQGLQAGDNTLNAHCARLLMRTLSAHQGRYDAQQFLSDYHAFMTADPPQHPDTYAESYHRGFFANVEKKVALHKCGAITHDTPSIGGLVGIAPLALVQRLRGIALQEVQHICRQHLALTHPDASLAAICDDYVELLDRLLFRPEALSAQEIIAACAKKSIGVNLPELARQYSNDQQVVGGIFSTACYIEGAWPSVLYLAYRYSTDMQAGLLANTNLGGDNVHRGAVLGALLGLVHATTLDAFFDQLTDQTLINAEILALL
jgi:ADP-ribosylglycohydrolase